MRVFTQRFHTSIELLSWEKPKLGQFPEFDAWVEKFNDEYPNVMPMDMHELDYKVWCSTPDNDAFFIVGYYWGDETTLPAATYWVTNNKVLNIQQRRWVITCNDDEHPAIGPIANMQIDDFLTSVQAVRQGHWLWSDKESFIPYEP